jgi:HAMP domain-containing protein
MLSLLLTIVNAVIACWRWLTERASKDERLGRLEQKDIDQSAAIKTADEINRVQAGPSGDEVTKKRLDDGTF